MQADVVIHDKIHSALNVCPKKIRVLSQLNYHYFYFNGSLSTIFGQHLMFSKNQIISYSKQYCVQIYFKFNEYERKEQNMKKKILFMFVCAKNVKLFAEYYGRVNLKAVRGSCHTSLSFMCACEQEKQKHAFERSINRNHIAPSIENQLK